MAFVTLENKKENESEKEYNKRVFIIQNEKKELIKIFQLKNKEFDKLKNILRIKKEKYDLKRNKDRFKVRFNQIKQNIKNLSRNHEYTQTYESVLF